MSARYKVVIPARYGATRFPGKPLATIGGKTLLEHVYESARASAAKRVIVATDDERIEKACRDFGADVYRTSPDHESGTDRVAEVMNLINEPDDALVVNVQGDEYGLPSALIDQVANALALNRDKVMATLCERITDRDELRDPNVVKVVFDNSGTALYFSRAMIPWRAGKAGEDDPAAYRHIGIYAYRVGFLKRFTSLRVCELERSERLEQLRALYNGYRVHVEEACAPCGIGVDTPEDLERARRHRRGLN